MNYKKYSAYFAFLFSLILSVNIRAQDTNGSKFRGQVTDRNKVALAGVTVQIQEQNERTLTSSDGGFEILCDVKDVLIFSKEGYNTVRKSAGNAVNSPVVMEISAIDAGENDDVEIPFDVRKKRVLTYAVSAVKADELPQLPSGNFSTILAGRLSGLYVQQTGTRPGNENVSFQIRGKSTYNGGNSPRVLVDGVFRDFAEMDLNQIESITVLKDAGALAWYGLNGANGVILVKTKRGSSNKTSISLNSQVGFQQRMNAIQPLNSYQYASLYNEALTNVGQSPVYNQEALDNYSNRSDLIRFPDNNYQERFLGDNSPQQRYVLSASGGNNSLRYFTTFSYFNQIGLLRQTTTEDFDSNIKYNRINFSVNLDFDVNKNFTVGLNASARSESRRTPGDGADAVFSDLYNLPPNAFPLLNEDGSYGGTSIYKSNPLARLQSRGYIRDLTRVMFTTVTAKHKLDFLTKGLSANLLFSYDASGVYTSGLTQNYEVFDMTTDMPVKFGTATPLAYANSIFSANNRRNELWAGFDYNQTFKNTHTVNASLRFHRSVDNSVERFDYRSQQVSARVDYGFNNRYFLGLVASYAGSENFAPSNRYGIFPAISAGWIAIDHQEPVSSGVMDYLKFRTSYGMVGNGAIGGTRLPFRSLYNRAPGYGFGTTFANSIGAVESSPANPHVTWEELKQFNVGADLKLFKKSLSLSLDYFNDTRSNILTTASVPGILGIDIQAVNEGVVTSKGAELSVSYDKKIGQVSLSLTGNYTYAKNKVISRNEDLGTIATQSSIGLNTGDVYLAGTKRFFIAEGLFNSFEEINNSPAQLLAGNVYPGDIKYKDVSGPDGVPDGIISSFDAVNTNYTDIPDRYFGLGQSISYKMFDLNVQWQGVQGRTIQIKTMVNSGPDNLNQFSLDRWTPETAQSAKWPRLAISDRGNNDANSDFWLRSGDYFKLRTLELGISLSKDFVQKLKIQKARFYIGGYNLLTFSKLDIDVDPEVHYAGFGSTYPAHKIYTLGLNVQF